MGGVLRWQRPQLSAAADGAGYGGGGGARWLLSDCGGDGCGADCEWQYDEEGRRRDRRWLH